MKWILSVASMPRVWRLGFWHNYFQGEVLVRSFRWSRRWGQSGCFWREEELDILKADYPRMRMSVTACLLGRNTMLVKIMARRLGLKKSRSSEAGFRSWSDEEWTLLEKNMYLSVAEQLVLLFPDRTKKRWKKREVV
ncbi:hypothetical protein O5207_06000 [Escherichia coli]|nr:hypothetical protein [Escherichia coli]